VRRRRERCLGLPHSARVDPCPRCVRRKTSSWCDGRFASFGWLPCVRDEAENALVQWVAYQCRCEGRLAFSALEAAECKILPLICSPGRRPSGAGDPDTLACHALLNAVSSRTKSPELPPVLYGTVTVPPTDFTGCQRSWSVGPAELESGSTRSEMSARSYTVYENCNQHAAAEEVHMARKPSVFPGVCV
jgi:hypothetical protein